MKPFTCSNEDSGKRERSEASLQGVKKCFKQGTSSSAIHRCIPHRLMTVMIVSSSTRLRKNPKRTDTKSWGEHLSVITANMRLRTGRQLIRNISRNVGKNAACTAKSS